MSYQQLIIVGNVGRDPELRYVGSGVAVTDISVAVAKKWTDAQGNKQETTTWYKVTCWRKTAEIVAQYVRKGKQVLVSASQIEVESYQARDGQNRVQIKVTADSVQLLGTRGDGNGDGGVEDGQTDAVYSSKPDNNDADIPF